MDKNTVSKHRWIMTFALVLAVMIALSTPFRTSIKDARWSTTKGLVDVQERAFDVLGVDLVDETADDIGIVGSDKTITLYGSKVADGIYTLKYENNGTPLTGYADICSLTITDRADAGYQGLITENCAPVGATAIGVYDSSDARIGEISLGSLKIDLGTKLYSFGAISDVHIGNKTASSDFQNALTYFENESDIEFIANCGDMATSGSDTNLTTYKSIVDTYTTKPIYEVTGNHEANRRNLAMDGMHAFTGEDLYYSFTKGNDVYIMVGVHDVYSGAEFSKAELDWLYETLEANKDKRCFLFMHLNPRDGSGDAVDLDLAGDMLNNTYGDVFYSLVSHYRNVIWFHGHTHQTFRIQAVNGMNNYDNIFGCHSVHIPSLSTPRGIKGSSLQDLTDESEGYVVDVYENHIVLRGRDFITGEFLPIASYCLNTSAKSIAANAYYDPTQTIVNGNSNILKSGSTWYEGSVDKTTITRIAFVKEYNSLDYDECWDASISGNNQVVAYRTGTEIILVGNENGIVANSNSSGMFNGFASLSQISGFENLDTANVTNFSSGFNGCSALTNVDLSVLDLSNVNSASSLFKGCSSLTSFKLSNNLSEQQYGRINIMGMFDGCTSLQTADISYLPNKNYSASNLFFECSSLTDVTFGTYTFKNCSNLFYLCKKISSIDLSTVNFSSATLNQAFLGCSSLQSVTFADTFDASAATDLEKTFYGCTNLTSVTIPDGVASVGVSAFEKCTNLTSVKIPASVTSIGDRAFYGCDNFTIYGRVGSYAAAYAEENDIPFEILVEQDPDSGNRLPGDVNDDGRVNNKDLGLLQRYINGWDIDIHTASGDVNGDGLLNNKDLGLLQRYINGWDVELK